jgi:nucleoside-diphosphate-sugar epimerase
MTLPYQRAFITGATGFIGSRIIRALVEHGVAPHLLARTNVLPPHLLDLRGAVTLHAGDLRDAVALEQAVVAANPEVIFHLAAYGTFTREKDVTTMIEVNVTGTVNLLSVMANHPCWSVVHTGSMKEYPASRVPLTEEALLKPWDDYAATKAAATLFCQLSAARHEVPVTILRLSPVYGPGDAETRFVGVAIRAARTGTPLNVTVGSLVRNFTYVDDVVDAYLRASVTPSRGEVFNIGGRETHSFDDIVTTIERITGHEIRRNDASSSRTSASDDSWVPDIRKARDILQWEPTVSLEEGLRRTVEWVRTHS